MAAVHDNRYHKILISHNIGCTYFNLVELIFQRNLTINLPAIQADFSACSRQRTYVPHVDHRVGKVGEEIGLTTRIIIDSGDGTCSRCGKQFLIRLKETHLNLQICKVVVVERIWSPWIQ